MGRKKAFCNLYKARMRFPHVYKTDVKSYYASINHDVLIGGLKHHIKNSVLLHMVCQVIAPTVFYRGFYGLGWYNSRQGLPLGCSLSPLLAAFYLRKLDLYFENKPQYFYQRYMDDIILLAKRKSQLRRGIKKIHEILGVDGYVQ